MGGRSGVAWLLNNQKFETYQFSKTLSTDRIRTVSKIITWEIGGVLDWLIIGLSTVSN